MFERIRIKQLNDHIRLLDDNHQATGYLVAGRERALMIDTGYGYENLKALTETLTDKPVTVINTHGHCDHTLGNIWFDEALIEERDIPLAIAHSHIPAFAKFREAQGLKMPPFRKVHDGDLIDLGGLTAEIISLPGHTAGGICILLREDRILFTGDSINRHLWLQLDESLSIRQTLENMDAIAWVRDRADRILHGHGHGFEDIAVFDLLRAGLRELCEQNGTELTDRDPDYEYFAGTALRHDFEGGSVIYSRRQLEPVDLNGRFAAIGAFCGAECTACAAYTDGRCAGCKAGGGRPDCGKTDERCAVAACCTEKGISYCADCGDFPCGKLTRLSQDGDPVPGTRIERLSALKKELLTEAKQGRDRISVCGFCCGEDCFLGYWCGGCRSVYNCCSFATLFPDGICPNVKCAGEKGLDGCWACPELEACAKGFYGIDDAGAVNLAKAGALFIRKFGKSIFAKALTVIRRKTGMRYDQYFTDKSDAQALFDGLYQIIEEA